MRYEWRTEGRTVIVLDEQETGATLKYRIDPPDNRLGHTAIFLREILRLAAERARAAKLEAALRVLVPLCIDALREAEGIGGEDLYEALPKAGLIEHVVYDPEQHGEIEGVEPGFEIWILTDLGKEFAEGKGGE